MQTGLFRPITGDKKNPPRALPPSRFVFSEYVRPQALLHPRKGRDSLEAPNQILTRAHAHYSVFKDHAGEGTLLPLTLVKVPPNIDPIPRGVNRVKPPFFEESAVLSPRPSTTTSDDITN